MSHTTITIKQARALVLVAPKDNQRWYLNGALFDFQTNRAVATDGHCLLAINLVAELPPSGCQAIIPRDALHDISRGGKVDGTIEIFVDDATFTLSRLNDTRANIAGKLIDGTYPDYERVMPRQVSGTLARFDAQLMARIDKALKLALDIDKEPSKLTVLGHNGEKGGSVLFVHGHSDQAIAVCMGLRAPQKGGWGSSDAEMLDFFSKGEAEVKAA